ncbi:MAG: Fic family protein [Paludibacter sp.]
MKYELEIIPVELLEKYNANVSKLGLLAKFQLLTDADVSTDSFSFYTSVASVFSSKIEGEDIELDSYIKHKKFGVEFKPDYTKKIDDLYNAYSFAKDNELNELNIAKAHTLLSTNLLTAHQQGEIRTQNMYVITDEGKIEYVAPTMYEVKEEISKLYSDIKTLLETVLSIEEVFYYASMIHLVFVKIHPFNDGNGRTARLLEKWFLAQKAGDKAWFVQSEKHYYQQHQVYYTNLRALGLEYPELNYNNALPFLLMLPNSML